LLRITLKVPKHYLLGLTLPSSTSTMLLRRASCLLGPVQRAANAGGAALPKLILVHAPPTSVIAGRAHFSAVPPPADPQQPQPAAAGGNHKAFSGVCAAEEGGASSVHEGRRPLSRVLPLIFRGPLRPPTPPPLPTQPVSWATLALVVAAGAGVVIYNNVAREKKKTEGER
jgi:hypothetical protein